jgi:hypothetical protein
MDQLLVGLKEAGEGSTLSLSTSLGASSDRMDQPDALG